MDYCRNNNLSTTVCVCFTCHKVWSWHQIKLINHYSLVAHRSPRPDSTPSCIIHYTQVMSYHSRACYLLRVFVNTDCPVRQQAPPPLRIIYSNSHK